jgi:asparagine synthase (glutamine-hydrolysing)
MRDLLGSKACRERGLYRDAYVQSILDDPEHQLTRLQGSKLWHLAALEFWLQRNVDTL